MYCQSSEYGSLFDSLRILTPPKHSFFPLSHQCESVLMRAKQAQVHPKGWRRYFLANVRSRKHRSGTSAFTLRRPCDAFELSMMPGDFIGTPRNFLLQAPAFCPTPEVDVDSYEPSNAALVPLIQKKRRGRNLPPRRGAEFSANYFGSRTSDSGWESATDTRTAFGLCASKIRRRHALPKFGRLC